MTYSPAWHLSGPKPYDVQVESLKRAHGHERYGFFLEQGLGKTALQLNDWIENHDDYDTAVVVAPNSFKQDWTLAPSEWGVGDRIATSMWPRDPITAGTSDKWQLNAINFEAIRSSGYDHVKALMDKRKCLLVVDESSFIKNFKSETARAVLDLSKRTKAVRLLNGTPLVQNVLDLFPQLKCLGELNGMNPYVFRNRYAVMGGFMGKQVVGVKNEEELHAIQDRCSIRALKKDWWKDCPDKIYVPLRLEMTDKQRKHYREMLEDFYTLVSGHEYTANMILGQMEKLRQVASGLLMDGDKFQLLDPIEKNPKVKAALDLMETGTGKMIVVHFYKRMGTELYEFFRKKGLNPSFIRGGMKSEDITEQKAKFNNDSASRVLVGQISASAMGHTLLGGPGNDRCHRMFFHDGTFNLRDRMQVEDRIHRGAQDRGCLYFDPVLSEIDQTQITALQKKTDLVEAVVNTVRALR